MMEGYYCSSSSEARQKYSLSSLMDRCHWRLRDSERNRHPGCIKERDAKLLTEPMRNQRSRERSSAQIVGCDFLLMSTNAITVDGELVNIDNTGNRVAFLFWSEQVIVVAGMNKLLSMRRRA